MSQIGIGRLGSNVAYCDPVQVSNLTGVTAVAGGVWHSLAVKGDGMVWSRGVDSSGGVEVYHTDGLGSVRATTNAAGTVTQTYQTDAFGVPAATQGSSTQPFGYTGEQRDGETGFVYLRARMYDPQIGRFLQRDPFAGGLYTPLSLNRYSYVLNNPVKLIDPSGLYEYRYEWYIGSERIVGSPESVMAYFQAHPREIFPFDLGQCDRIEINAQCDLATGPSNYAPVQVTAITSTRFTFTALPGHFDYNPQAPADSWIRFRIFKRDGAIYLEQKARALVDDRLVDFVAPKFAYLFAWAQQAQNLRKIFNPFYPAEPMPQAGA